MQGDLAAAQGAAAALEGRLLAAERRAEALVGEHAAALAAQQDSTAGEVEERVQARVAGVHDARHLPVTLFWAGLHSGLLLAVGTQQGCAETPCCCLMVAQDSNISTPMCLSPSPSVVVAEVNTPVVVVSARPLSRQLAELVQSRLAEGGGDAGSAFVLLPLQVPRK